MGAKKYAKFVSVESDRRNYMSERCKGYCCDPMGKNVDIWKRVWQAAEALGGWDEELSPSLLTFINMSSIYSSILIVSIWELRQSSSVGRSGEVFVIPGRDSELVILIRDIISSSSL